MRSPTWVPQLLHECSCYWPRLRSFEPEDFFGERALAGHPVRVETATAVAATTVLIVPKTGHDSPAPRSTTPLSDRFITHMLARNIRIAQLVTSGSASSPTFLKTRSQLLTMFLAVTLAVVEGIALVASVVVHLRDSRGGTCSFALSRRVDAARATSPRAFRASASVRMPAAAGHLSTRPVVAETLWPPS
jgi:hypothetical protein